MVESSDEVSAKVLDCGSPTLKAGYAGNKAPLKHFPNVEGGTFE